MFQEKVFKAPTPDVLVPQVISGNIGVGSSTGASAKPYYSTAGTGKGVWNFFNKTWSVSVRGQSTVFLIKANDVGRSIFSLKMNLNYSCHVSWVRKQLTPAGVSGGGDIAISNPDSNSALYPVNVQTSFVYPTADSYSSNEGLYGLLSIEDSLCVDSSSSESGKDVYVGVVITSNSTKDNPILYGSIAISQYVDQYAFFQPLK